MSSFVCAMCGGSFLRGRSKEEALAEMKQFFGDVPETEELAELCDNCYRRIDPAKHPELVKEVRRQLGRDRAGS
jgi:hypothetical protein